MIREQVFTDNGSIYKEVRVYEDAYKDPYIEEQHSYDPIAPFYKLVDGNKKKYSSTEELRTFLGCSNNTPGADLSGFDICPLITLIAGTAIVENTSYKELFFRVDNSKVLKDIASYYNLPYPINTDIADLIDNDPGIISSYWNNEGEEIVLGSVRFKNDTPVLCKLHALYKDQDKWFFMNKGRVFEEGKVIETGAWYISRHLPAKYESTTPTGTVKYLRTTLNTGDPLVCWDAHITDSTTGKTKIKHYESSKAVRTAVCNMTSGSNYGGYNKAPDVTWWLGKSWIKDGNEEELFFHVESKDMLDNVCYYYKLPVPYSAELEPVLLNNLKSIRFKSYDLLKLGEGSFIEIVVASIVFTEGVPTGIRLYEIKRPNE